MAKRTGGRAYGPINNNPNQLPQIFIKEATVVRRSLIHEDRSGIPVTLHAQQQRLRERARRRSAGVRHGADQHEERPARWRCRWSAGKANDPLLAHWQTGLGKVGGLHQRCAQQVAANWLGTGELREVLGAGRARRVARRR